MVSRSFQLPAAFFPISKEMSMLVDPPLTDQSLRELSRFLPLRPTLSRNALVPSHSRCGHDLILIFSLLFFVVVSHQKRRGPRTIVKLMHLTEYCSQDFRHQYSKIAQVYAKSWNKEQTLLCDAL